MKVDEKKLYLIVGRNIRQARDKARLNQTELATLIGMERTSITNIEAGKQKVTLYALYRIALALKINLRYLLPDSNELLKHNVRANNGPVMLGYKTLDSLNKHREQLKLGNEKMTVDEHCKKLEPHIEQLCKDLDIADHFFRVKVHNPSKDLPYHNWYHALCMVSQCFRMSEYCNLPMSSVRSLLKAALWHDYGHSGGAKSDSTNVYNSIREYRKYTSKNFVETNSAGPLSYIDSSGPDDVTAIIAITEYPYVLVPRTVEQKIIRDADLMQHWIDDTWYEMCITRLGKEMSVKEGRELTELEMVEGQIAFLSNVTWNTAYGQESGNFTTRKRIEELNIKRNVLIALRK